MLGITTTSFAEGPHPSTHQHPCRFVARPTDVLVPEQFHETSHKPACFCSSALPGFAFHSDRSLMTAHFKASPTGAVFVDPLSCSRTSSTSSNQHERKKRCPINTSSHRQAAQGRVVHRETFSYQHMRTLASTVVICTVLCQNRP